MFVTNRVGSTEKARALIGFEATVPLAAGLQSVVEWRARDSRATAGRV
jgi:nucleoside-diphosphate-sugar epimerase